MALRVQRKVNHHDRVLLHHANQEQYANGRDDGQVLAKNHQRAQGSYRGRWQARQNGDGVDIAFVQHPQQYINH